MGVSMKSSHKVSIGACDPGSVNAAWAYTMIQLTQARSSRLGPFIRIEGSGLLSKLRNRVVATFLDNTKSDWLLMIDTDEQLSVQAFDKLIETAHDKDRPVVAGLYFAAWDANENLYPVPVPLIFNDTNKGFAPINDYKRNAVFEIGEWISEDLLFCRKIKHLGFPIYANTGAILPHQKRYWLHEGHHTERQSNEDI
jgi:hypothetical protein